MSFLGSFFGPVMGAISSAFQYNQAQGLQERQFNYQKQLFDYMNSNKHQLEVSDLKAAGLNPILSATGGQAVSPGGVSSGEAKGPDLAGASAAVMHAQAAKLNAQTEVIKAQNSAKLIDSQIPLNNYLADKAKNESDFIGRQANLIEEKIKTEIVGRQWSAKESEARIGQIEVAKKAAIITANAQSTIAAAQWKLSHIKDRLSVKEQEKLQAEIDSMQGKIAKAKNDVQIYGGNPGLQVFERFMDLMPFRASLSN